MSGHWSIQISSTPARKLFCTVKVKSNHRSKFPNLSNWKEEAWKKSGLQRDSYPWPLRRRCDALPTATTSVHIWIISYILHVISRLTGRYERLLLSNCLNWEIYCDDHSSLSSTTAVHIWIISYILHVISCLKERWWRLWPSFQSLKLGNLLRRSLFILIHNYSAQYEFFQIHFTLCCTV